MLETSSLFFATSLRSFVLAPQGIGLLLGFLFLLWLFFRFESSDANQWLLLIRDGRPKKAGIGIRVFRWPGDIVVRFTSTMQRVTFEAEVLSKESQYLKIQGFLLWSVSNQSSEHPFLAYSKLGIPSRTLAQSQIPTSHHALSKPQHHALRKMVEAVIRKTAVRFPVSSLLSEPAALLEILRQDLRIALLAWGTHLEGIEVIEVSIRQAEIFELLQAPYVEKSRQEAHEIRLVSERKRETLTSEQKRDLAIMKAQAQRAQEVEMARIEMEKEQEKSRLFEQEIENKKHRLAQQETIQTMQEAFNLAQKLRAVRDQEAAKLREIQADKTAQEAQDGLRDAEIRAKLHRQSLEIDGEIARLQALLAVESQKTEEIRHAEMTQNLVRSLTDAFRALPLKEIRWLSSSNDGPQGMLLDLVDSVRRFLDAKNPRPSSGGSSAAPSTSGTSLPSASSSAASSPSATEPSEFTIPLAGGDDLLEWP